MSTVPNILMCPPDYYGIEYEINPWMDRTRQADRHVATDQWLALRSLLEHLGAAASCVPPVEGLPDLVFTANAALIHRDAAIVSRFRHPQRQREEEHFAAWLAQHGFTLRRLEGPGYFEGAGDALFCGETLFAGYRIRSDVGALQEIGSLLGCQVIPLELVQPRFYHIDTCFCPVTSESAIWYPQAFDNYGRRVLHQAVHDLITVRPEEAERFACNAVVVGQSVVTNTGCPELHERLRSRGLAVYETPLDEFTKAGGSAKCLTLRLDGEDAAAWRRQPTA